MIEYVKNINFKQEVTQMKVITIQVGIFFSQSIDRPDFLIETFNKKMGNIFDKMPVILPIPNNIPDDMPIVILSSKNEKFESKIAKGRCDLFIHFDFTEGDVNISIEMYRTLLQKYIECFSNYAVNRIGVVTTLFYECKDPVKKISDKYFAGNYKNRAEIAIRYNEKKNYKRLELNNIFYINDVSLRIKGSEDEHIGALIKYDINNVPTEKDLNYAKLKEILDFALNRVIGDYQEVI